MAVENEVFFIVGCPRSGSTFLNHVMRDYLDIGFASEFQVIPKYYKKMHKYGDLQKKQNLSLLADDILSEGYFKIFETAYSEKLGRRVKITKHDIFEYLPEPSLAGVVFSALKATAVKLEKSRVGNKHLIMGLHPDWLDELFPNCKVINLIRDGRDCALSLKRMRWGHANTYAAAKFWAENITKPRDYFSSNADRYIEVRYEDFLENPIYEMNRLYVFIEGGNANDDKNTPDFSGLENRVKKGSLYKWKQWMDPKDIAIFQVVAGDILISCGYELRPLKTRINPIKKLYYTIENQILREYKVRFRKDMPA